MPHQCLSPGRAYAVYIIQDRVYLAFAPQLPVIFDGKSVRFVLNPGNQPERLGRFINRYLYVMLVQYPGPMMVILHHAAYWYMQMQLI